MVAFGPYCPLKLELSTGRNWDVSLAWGGTFVADDVWRVIASRVHKACFRSENMYRVNLTQVVPRQVVRSTTCRGLESEELSNPQPQAVFSGTENLESTLGSMSHRRQRQ